MNLLVLAGKPGDQTTIGQLQLSLQRVNHRSDLVFRRSIRTKVEKFQIQSSGREDGNQIVNSAAKTNSLLKLSY